MSAIDEPTVLELARAEAQERAVLVRKAGGALIVLLGFYAVVVVGCLIVVLGLAVKEGGTDGLALGLGGAAAAVLGLAPTVAVYWIVGRVAELVGALFTYRIEQDWIDDAE